VSSVNDLNILEPQLLKQATLASGESDFSQARNLVYRQPCLVCFPDRSPGQSTHKPIPWTINPQTPGQSTHKPIPWTINHKPLDNQATNPSHGQSTHKPLYHPIHVALEEQDYTVHSSWFLYSLTSKQISNLIPLTTNDHKW